MKRIALSVGYLKPFAPTELNIVFSFFFPALPHWAIIGRLAEAHSIS